MFFILVGPQADQLVWENEAGVFRLLPWNSHLGIPMLYFSIWWRCVALNSFEQVVVCLLANLCFFEFQLPCTLTRIYVVLKCVALGKFFKRPDRSITPLATAHEHGRSLCSLERLRVQSGFEHGEDEDPCDPFKLRTGVKLVQWSKRRLSPPSRLVGVLVEFVTNMLFNHPYTVDCMATFNVVHTANGADYVLPEKDHVISIWNGIGCSECRCPTDPLWILSDVITRERHTHRFLLN